MSTKRFIVLAATKKIGHQAAKLLDLNVVAVVTPHSPHAAYGITADAIHDDGSLTPEERDRLMERALASIATHPIPEGLCGVGGCVYLAGHEAATNEPWMAMWHSWERAS